MDNTDVVTNLNADLLDGFNSSDFARASHDHYRISLSDDRAKYPSQISGNSVRAVFGSFMQNSTLGISNFGDYSDVLVLRSYGDHTGGNDNAIIFNKNSSSVWHTQFGFGSTTSWGTPYLFLDSNNYSTYAATANHTHDGRYVRSFPGEDIDPSTTYGYWHAMTTQSGITGDWWHVLHMDWSGAANWRSELALPTQHRNGVYYRSDNWSWSNWVKLLDADNYTDYTVTKTGSGASGTWGISISGSSASASTASSVDWTGVGGQMHGGNEFNIINYNYPYDSFWINYLPRDNRTYNPTAVGTYYIGNGATGLASLHAAGYIKNGSDNTYVLLGGGGHAAISGLSVSYASSAGSALSASSATVSSYFPTCYIGGDQSNPQTYFSSTIGCRVAMTRYADVGMGTAWHDTLWINGYSGGDVPWMCALTFKRNGEPRFAVSTQANTSSSYGTMYEVITSYNIGSQSVNYATSAGSASSASYASSASSASSAGSATEASRSRYLTCPDTRDSMPSPSEYTASTTGVSFDFKYNPSTTGLSGASYSGVMTVRPYAGGGDWSGGPAHQLAFNGDGALYHRTGDSSWGSWERIWTSNNSNLTASGNIYAAGAITAGSASDLRLKRDIVALNSPADILSKLRPIKYAWNSLATSLDPRNTGCDVGFVAQEVMSLIPEAVTQDYFEDYYRLNQIKIIPYLVKGWQDHENRIEAIEKSLKSNKLL